MNEAVEDVTGVWPATHSRPVPYYEYDGITIYHGDARALLPLLNLQVAAVITDPPYGETSLDWDVWPKGWPTLLFDVAPQLWCFGSMRMFMQEQACFAGWKFAQDVIWEKHNGSGFAADRFKRVHEVAAHFYRGEWGALYRRVPTEEHSGPKKSVLQRGLTPHTGRIGAGGYEDNGTRLMRSVIPARSCHGYAEHPTQKPEAIVRPLIEFSVPKDGVVLDCFMGSGTTLSAAKTLGRRAVGIERQERYCETAAKRLAQGILL